MKRPQATPTDGWQQWQPLAKAPKQRTYELSHPRYRGGG